MSRVKKSRSLKRVTGGVKTGTKERTKLERKQRKAKQQAANPIKKNRQRSVYQRFIDENKPVDTQHATKPQVQTQPVQEPIVEQKQPRMSHKSVEKESLWDQLEQPKNTDTF